MKPSHLPTVTILGVGLVLVRDGHYLLGLRKSKLGFGTWGFPGGHVEAGEDPLVCAACELAEETGLKLMDAKVAGWSSHADSERRYVTLYVEGRAEGEALVGEPAKCEAWRWLSRSNFPAALFGPTAAYFRSV